MKWSKWTLFTASALVLAACANGGNDNEQADQEASTGSISKEEAIEAAGGNKVSGPAVPVQFDVQNEGEPIEGGTLQVAIVGNDPFRGTFSDLYTEDSNESQILGITRTAFFSEDADGKIGDKGAVTQDIDQDNKTVTYHINEDLTWSDGEPVTSDDLIFTQELVASPEYEGLAYDPDALENVEGVKEYHEGEADHISGIEKIDDKTVKFHLKEIQISLKYGGGGPYTGIEPKHYLENIPIKDLSSSDEIRKHPLTYGPFQVENVVDGESVEYVPNEYFYKGDPKLDKIVLTRVPASGITPALEQHKYDIVLAMPTDNFDTYSKIPGYTFSTRVARSYGYLDFKLGKWDPEKEENIPDPNAKLADPALRQALGYAIDNDAIGQKFEHGLSWNANSPIAPVYRDVYDPEQPGFYYDPEKAMQILDDAGYKDTDGDGLREKPDGSKLTINFWAGGEDPVSQYYIQAWQAVGLDVEFLDGRGSSGVSYYDRVQSDDPEVDIFTGGWGLGTDPDPTGLYGRRAPYNWTRYATEEQDEIFENLVSEKAFNDPEYQKEQYKRWQQYVVDDPAGIPATFGLLVTPVNKRVKHYNWGYETEKATGWDEIEVTADEPLEE